MNNSNNTNNPNDHKKVTPSSKEDQGKKEDPKYTSYHTEREETSDPQKVRKEIEPEGLEERLRKSE